jgi:subtilisin family serine protease
MKNHVIAISLLGLLAPLVITSVEPLPASAIAPTGDYIVILKDGVNLDRKVAKEAGLGNAVSDVYSSAVDGFVAELENADVVRLRKDKEVLLVELDRTLSINESSGALGPDLSDLMGVPVDDQYIVTLKDDVAPRAFATSEAATGSQILSVYTNAINGFAAVLDASALERLAKDPNVESIEQDRIVVLQGDQVDPPWGLDRVDQRSGTRNSRYSYANTGAGVTAYVIDTGILESHVDFGGRVGAGYTAYTDGRGTTDCNGHGTHVAGTIGGSTYGIAKAVSLIPIRVLSCSGSGSISGVIAGINWAISDHASGSTAVANMSLGGLYSAALNSAVANATADGIVFAVAAGNNNRLACSYSPASAPTAITVGAIGGSDDRASFTNYGSCLDVFAPGVSIKSATIASSSAWRLLSGTSMASPHVAGAAALLLQSDPTATPAQIAALIVNSATPDVITGLAAGSPNLVLYTGAAFVSPNPVAPSVPTSLTAVGGVTQASLSWTAPTQSGGADVTDYVVEYSSNSGSTWTVFADGVSTSTSATVTGLTNGTTYQFRVKAVSSGGTSEASSTATAVVGVPSAPTSLSATPLGLSIRLSWTAPAQNGGSVITDYVAQFSTDSGATWSTFSDSVSTSTTTTVTGLTNGLTYQLRVSAVNSVGTSAPSSVVIAVPWAASLPSAPLDLAIASYGLNQVGLSWTIPATNGGDTITDYVIEYSSNSGSTWTTFTDLVTSLRSATVTDLVNGVSYIFRVSARNSAGTGDPSVVSAAVSPGLPTAPCCITEMLVGPQYVALRWGAPTFDGGSTVTNYVIEYTINDGVSWTTWSEPTGNGINRTITGLTDGVPHKFRISARNAIGTGPPSEVSDAYTPLTPTTPGRPLNAVATANTGQVGLDWDTPTSDGGAPITDYLIEYSSNSGSTWTTYVDTVSTATIATIRSLPVGISVLFRVSAINSRGTGAASLNSNSITTIGSLTNDPFAGADLFAGTTGAVSSSTLTASRESGEPSHGGYGASSSIWYKWIATQDGTLVVDTRLSNFDTLLGAYTGTQVNALTTLAANDDSGGGTWSSVTVSVVAGTSYFFAIDGYGNRKGSTTLNWQFTQAPDPSVPSAPRNVRGSAGDQSAVLYWEAPLDNGSRTITSYVATSSPGSKTCSSTGALTCTVRGLTNGVAYTFSVTATNSIGTSSASVASAPVTPTAASTPEAPTTVWGLDRIDQRALPLNNQFSRAYTGSGVTAYIIDTGVLSTHTEFGGRVLSGFTSISDSNGTEDCNGHGTHVAGTVGGSNYGVAPGVAIVPVRVLDCSGSGSTSGVIAGIDWVIANHVAGTPAVANMSLGGGRSSALDIAVRSAVADGVVFVVAAGNSTANACQSSPAGEPLAITVGSTTSADARSSFSNYGSCVDVFAPGSSITSAWYTSTTASNTISGTSMASPHVAGVVALGLEIAPNSSVAQISDWITSTATPGIIGDAGTGSPNLLVYSRLSASPPGASAPTTTLPTTTLPTTTLPTTTVPAGDDGGGGGDDNGGGDDAPETTTTIARRVSPPSTVPATTVPQIQASTPIDDLSKLLPVNRMLNPILGSQIPIVVAQAVFAPSSNKVVGNNVVLKVNAPAQSMVHVYRDGILVKSVSAAAAQSIKIAKNKVGESSFQILIVDKKGVITTTKKSTVRVQKASK